jgi:hypothetical protein
MSGEVKRPTHVSGIGANQHGGRPTSSRRLDLPVRFLQSLAVTVADVATDRRPMSAVSTQRKLIDAL